MTTGLLLISEIRANVLTWIDKMCRYLQLVNVYNYEGKIMIKTIVLVISQR